MHTPIRVLITGAYGLIGNLVCRQLYASPDQYDVYGLVRRRQASDRLPQASLLVLPDDKLYAGSTADMDIVRQAVQGMDVVVHMAADPNTNATWDSLLPNNIIATRNILEASRQAGVRRVIVASTVQVVWGYCDQEPYASLWAGRFDTLRPSDIKPITHEQPARPINLYGASKVWAEALAHVYAHTTDLSCLCVRIGWVDFIEPPQNPRSRSMWCSQRDITHLIECCINAPKDLRFDIFFGISDNTFKLVDIEHPKQVVKYNPKDNWDRYI